MRSDTTSGYKKRDVERNSSIVLSRNTLRTGVSTSGHERNHLFMNVDGDAFREHSGLSGLDSEADGRSFAWLDYDRDGLLDVAVVNANAPLLELFHNEMGGDASEGGGRFLALRLVGGNHTAQASQDWSARDAFGARVSVVLGERTLHREHRAGAGLGAQNSDLLHIGIGEGTVERVHVGWPSGRSQDFLAVPTDRRVTLYENPAQSPSGSGIHVETYLRQGQRAVHSGDLEGQGLSVAHLPAHPLYVFITTATWCGSCREAMPHVARLREHFAPGDLGLYAVPTGEPAPVLERYWIEHHPPYLLLDQTDAADEILIRQALEHAGSALPSTVITDGRGQVVHAFSGVPTVSDVARLLTGAASRGPLRSDVRHVNGGLR